VTPGKNTVLRACDDLAPSELAVSVVIGHLWEMTKHAPQTCLASCDDDGNGLGVVGDDRPSKPHDGVWKLLASRVFSYGAGEDGSHQSFCLFAFAIGEDTRWGHPSGSVARSGHIECTAIAAQVGCRGA
jgi:hypothetical protein